MNIGIYGNDSNVGLLIAEGLRLLGHEPFLVVTQRDPWHRPEGLDERLAAGYPSWIFDASDCDDIDYAFVSPKVLASLNFLAPCDFLVLNDVGPSLAAFWGRPYACVLTGADLGFLTSEDVVPAMVRAWGDTFRASPWGRLVQRRWWELIARQRDGIAAAAQVMHPGRGVDPQADTALDELGVAEGRRSCFVPVCAPRSEPAASAASDRLQVVAGGWVTGMHVLARERLVRPGVDSTRLLDGVARFVAADSAAAVALRLVERGADPSAQAAMIRDRGLGASVTCRNDILPREFLAEIWRADLVIDHCGPGSPGLAAWAGLAAGKPVIAQWGAWPAQFGEPIPACNAGSAAEIADWLQRLRGDAGLRADLASRAAIFAGRHLAIAGQLERVLVRL